MWARGRPQGILLCSEATLSLHDQSSAKIIQSTPKTTVESAGMVANPTILLLLYTYERSQFQCVLVVICCFKTNAFTTLYYL